MPPPSLAIAGAAIASLSLALLLVKLLKKKKLFELQGKVVIITGASSGLGEGMTIKHFYTPKIHVL